MGLFPFRFKQALCFQPGFQTQKFLVQSAFADRAQQSA